MTVDVVTGTELYDSVNDALASVILLGHNGTSILRSEDGSFLPTFGSKHVLELCRSYGLKGVFSKIVCDAALKAESMTAGASAMIPSMIFDIFRNCQGKNINATADEIIAVLGEKIVPPTRDVVFDAIKRVVSDELVYRIVCEAIILAGSECKIVLDDSAADDITIEKLAGFVFSISPDAAFYRGEEWSATNVRCFVVDGLIESVSEIDTLLTRCNTERVPMVIFARGYKDDVIATLRLNYARQTLNVIPVVVPFALKTVNVLNDLAVATGARFVSSLSGDLISTVGFDDLGIVDRIVCRGSSVSIENPRAIKAVTLLTNELSKKRSNSWIEDEREILAQRIRSLTTARVVIRVPMSLGVRASRLREDVDQALRTVRTVLHHGVVSDETLSKIRHYKQYECFLRGVSEGTPILTIAVAVKTAAATAALLLDTGAALENTV